MSGSQDNDMDDIVQSFVHTDLASLDRIGGEPDTFALSPHLTEQSPSLQQQSPRSAPDQFASTTSKAAREGPELLTPQPPTMATQATQTPAAQVSPKAYSPPSQSAGAEARPSAGSRVPSGHSSTRNVSISSAASVSTQEREKRGSLGDKFKMFGKRITSGSKK